jgi:hypothetical protein
MINFSVYHTDYGLVFKKRQTLEIEEEKKKKKKRRKKSFTSKQTNHSIIYIKKKKKEGQHKLNGVSAFYPSSHRFLVIGERTVIT